jgi:hypothetical protein
MNLPDDDQPIPLTDAVSLFPQAKLTVSTLRAEAARGRLEVFRIGRRDYTTAKALHEMVHRCREEDPRRVSTSTEHAGNGSSETERLASAQVALSTTVTALKQSSPRISAKSTRPNAGQRH